MANPPIPPSAPARIVVAGLGRIAEIQLAALARQNDFVCAGVCDPDSSRRGTARAHGVPFFSTLTECLAATACDAVLVSTPSDIHFAVASEVLMAGRHLLLEKPAGVRAGEVAALQSLAKAAGLQFQTALHMSRGAEVDWLVQHLQEGYGHPANLPVTGFECRFHDPLYLDGTLHPRAASVLGSWVDSGINALSVLARFLPVETIRVADTACQRIPGLPVRDVSARVAFTGDGLSGIIVTEWTRDTCEKTTVLHFADGSQWSLDHHAETATLTGHQGTTAYHCARHPDRMTAHYLGVFADFASALKTGKSNAGLSETLHGLLVEAEAPVKP